MRLDLDLVAALAEEQRLAALPVVVRQPSASLIYRSPAFPALRGRAEAAAAQAAGSSDGLSTVEDRDGAEYRLATIVVPRAGTTSVVVQMTTPLEPVRHILRQLLVTMLLWFALVIACASYGGSFITRRALEPVDAIVSRVREIQAGLLNDCVHVRTGSDELDRLVDTLNDLLDRLGASVQSARRFATDASHELQTPIAAMRAALDACIDDRRTTASEFRLTVEDLVAELDRLSALVRDLRLLSLADAGHLLDRVELIDLGALVHDCCDIVRAAAEPRNIAISVDVLVDVTVPGSPLHLRRALLNLAQNAVKYSPDGSTVQVSVGRLEAQAVLVVVDHGCGIAAEDVPHIFERFYRADPARARETGGSGLGLAIADQIVRSHGGRIEVSSVAGEGSVFAVFLPLAAASDLPPLHPLRSMNAA